MTQADTHTHTDETLKEVEAIRNECTHKYKREKRLRGRVQAVLINILIYTPYVLPRAMQKGRAVLSAVLSAVLRLHVFVCVFSTTEERLFSLKPRAAADKTGLCIKPLSFNYKRRKWTNGFN